MTAQDIVNYFMTAPSPNGSNWTYNSALAITANILREDNSLDPAVTNASGAQGIAQWTGSRITDFKAMFGVNPNQSTIDNQLKFMNYELNGKYANAGLAIQNSSNYADATTAMQNLYEIPETPGTNKALVESNKRITLADKIANMFGANNQSTLFPNSDSPGYTAPATPYSSLMSNINDFLSPAYIVGISIAFLIAGALLSKSVPGEQAIKIVSSNLKKIGVKK